MAAALSSLVFVVGLAAVAAGFWMLKPAAGVIVAGLLVALVSLLWRRGLWTSSAES